MESDDERLDHCLERLRNPPRDVAITTLLATEVPALLHHAESTAWLIGDIAYSNADADITAEETLLTALLDEARRAREDGKSVGHRALSEATAMLEDLDADVTSREATIVLARIHHQAGLPLPPALEALQGDHWGAFEGAEPSNDPTSAMDMADLTEGLAQSLQPMRAESGDDAFAIYDALAQNIAGIPDAGCEALIREIAQWSDPFWGELVLYALLDPRSALRRGAAAGLRNRASTSALETPLARRLGWVRALMPDEPSRAVVDAALSADRKRRRGWPAPEPHVNLAHAQVSVPDGVGAQYLILGSHGDSGLDWALVLIKSGYGVRDAYILPDQDEREAAELWKTLADSADMRAMHQSRVVALLSAALAENHANGEPPPPGLIDALATTGLTELRPRALEGRDWLSVLDPDGRLATLTPQKRGRLINHSAHWHEKLAVLGTWVEDNTEVEDILSSDEPPKRQQRALRAYLETRRAWWAEQCLRSALVIPAYEADELADSLAVTGLALLDGREFRRLPLLEAILGDTIEAYLERLIRGESGRDDEAQQAAAEAWSIFTELGGIEAGYPRSLMEQALAHREAITPLLLMQIEAAIADPTPLIEGDNARLLFALVLLGHFQEPHAHDVLLRLAALPDDGAEALLDDGITKLLPVHLWQTSGGETTGLRWLLENRDAGEFARIAAVEALVFGVLLGELDRATICDYLAGLLDDDTLAFDDDALWLGLVWGLIDLFPDAHEARLRRYIRNEQIDLPGIGERDLDRVLAQGRSQALAAARERATRRFPESIHGYFTHWTGFQSPADHDRIGMAVPFDASGSPGAGASSADPRKKKKRKQQKKARKTNRRKR